MIAEAHDERGFWKGNVFDWDRDVRPTAVDEGGISSDSTISCTESNNQVEDRWGDPELSNLLNKHSKYWKGKPLYLNRRTSDLRMLDIQLQEFQATPAIAHYRTTWIAKESFNTPHKDGRDHDSEDGDEDCTDRLIMGGGGNVSPCVMIVLKNPGRRENISGSCLDARGFAGQVARAAQTSIVESGRDKNIGIHVAYIAPFYPFGEWTGDVPDRIAELFSFYFKMRVIITKPKVVLAVGSYVAKFLSARCSVRSMKYVERPAINYPFSVKLKPAGASNAGGSAKQRKGRGDGVDCIVISIVHPFLTWSQDFCTAERREKNQEDYARGFTILKEQLQVGQRKLNAFSVLMGRSATTPADGDADENADGIMTPPGFKALIVADTGKIFLAISGKPAKRQELDYLVMQKGIGTVLSLTTLGLPPTWKNGLGYNLVHLPLENSEEPKTAPSLPEVSQAVKVATSAWQKRQGLLVHCKYGTGHSVMIAAAILMEALHVNSETVVERLRRQVDPDCLREQYQLDFLAQVQAAIDDAQLLLSIKEEENAQLLLSIKEDEYGREEEGGGAKRKHAEVKNKDTS